MKKRLGCILYTHSALKEVIFSVFNPCASNKFFSCLSVSHFSIGCFQDSLSGVKRSLNHIPFGVVTIYWPFDLSKALRFLIYFSCSGICSMTSEETTRSKVL